MKSFISNEKKYPLLRIKLLLPFLVMLCLFALFLANLGCGEKEKKKFDLGYKVYIPNLSDKTITVVPAKESVKTTTVDLEHSPLFLCRVPNKDRIYVLQEGTNEISILDTTNDTITNTFKFEVGTSLAQTNRRIKFSPDGKTAYVLTDYMPAGIAVMDVTTNSFVTGINLKTTSIDRLYFTQDLDKLYATDPSAGKIYDIDPKTNELTQDYTVPESFSYAYYYARDSMFYMAESGSNASVKAYDLANNTFTKRIDDVGDDINFLLPSSDGKKLYVITATELVILTISDFTIDDRISFSYSDPVDFKFLPDSSFLLAPSAASNLLMILKPDFSPYDTIATGTNPGEIVIME